MSAAYAVQPEYTGSSFVPSKITITAGHRGKSDGFHPVIEVW